MGERTGGCGGRREGGDEEEEIGKEGKWGGTEGATKEWRR